MTDISHSVSQHAHYDAACKVNRGSCGCREIGRITVRFYTHHVVFGVIYLVLIAVIATAGIMEATNG